MLSRNNFLIKNGKVVNKVNENERNCMNMNKTTNTNDTGKRKYDLDDYIFGFEEVPVSEK